MAIKFDKEALLKHYFWVVSSVFLLLVLGLAVLEFLNEPGVKEKAEYDGALKSVQSLTSGFKNADFLPKWDERLKEYEKDKNGAWEKAWAPQSTIYDWPDALRERESFLKAGQPVFPTYPNYNLYDAAVPNIIYPSMVFNDDERRTFKDAWYAEGFDRAWVFMSSAWKNPDIISYSKKAAEAKVDETAPKGDEKGTFITYARFKQDGEGDVLQANLPFKLAVSSAPTAGAGGADAKGGGAMIPGGMGGSSPGPGGDKGSGGMAMPGGGSPGGATAAPVSDPAALAKASFLATMRQFTAWQVTPTKEEIWLLQEEYWIRREMITLLRESVASIATFHKSDSQEVAPAGADGRIKLTNAFWELDLVLENGGRQISKRSRIKNIHLQQRPQPLADPRTGIQVEFVFYQNGFRRTAQVKLDGEVIPYGKSAPFAKDFDAGAIDFKKPFDLVQVFTPGTSPIRMVEGLELPFNSHRTMTSKLLARKTLKKEGASKGAEAGGAPGGMAMGGDTAGGSGGPGAMMGGMGKDGPGGGKAGDLTPYNKLDRSRYIISTDTCRHLPFAMKLTLDQSTLPTVITALSNSKLRVQVTQVQYQYIPFGASQSIGGGPGMPGGGGMAMPGMPGMPGGMRGGAMPGMPGMPGGAGGGMAMPGMPGMPGGAGGGMAMPGMPGMPGGGPGGSAAMRPGGRGGDDADTGGGGGPAGPGALGAGFNPSALADGNLIDVALYGIAVLYERFPEDPNKLAAAAGAAAPTSPNTP